MGGGGCLLCAAPLIASGSPWIVPSGARLLSLALTCPQQSRADPAMLRLQLRAAGSRGCWETPGEGAAPVGPSGFAVPAWGSSGLRLPGLGCARGSRASTESSGTRRPGRPGSSAAGDPLVWQARPTARAAALSEAHQALREEVVGTARTGEQGVRAARPLLAPAALGGGILRVSQRKEAERRRRRPRSSRHGL